MPRTTKAKQTINVKTTLSNEAVENSSAINEAIERAKKYEESQLGLFDYSSLDANTAKLAKQSAIEIKAREKAIWENIIEIGNRLIEVKNALPHGQFEDWVKTEFKWSKMTASKYIKVAKEIEPKVKDSLLLPNSLEGLYQLASGLSKADEETKEEILTAVESKTEEKGTALTEKEIKEITKPYLEQIKELENKQTSLITELEKEKRNTEWQGNVIREFNTKGDPKIKQLEETVANQNKQIQELNSLKSQLEKRQAELAEKEDLVMDQFSNLSETVDSEVKAKLQKERDLALADVESQKLALKKEQDKIKKELTALTAEKERFTRANKWLELLTEYNLEFAKMCDRLKYISSEINNLPKFDDLGEYQDTAQKNAQIQMDKFSDNLDLFGKFNSRIIMAISRIDKNPLKAYDVTAEVIDD